MRCDPDLLPQPAGPAGTSQLTCPSQRPAWGKDSHDDDEDGHDKHNMEENTLKWKHECKVLLKQPVDDQVHYHRVNKGVLKNILSLSKVSLTWTILVL